MDSNFNQTHSASIQDAASTALFVYFAASRAGYFSLPSSFDVPPMVLEAASQAGFFDPTTFIPSELPLPAQVSIPRLSPILALAATAAVDASAETLEPEAPMIVSYNDPMPGIAQQNWDQSPDERDSQNMRDWQYSEISEQNPAFQQFLENPVDFELSQENVWGQQNVEDLEPNTALQANMEPPQGFSLLEHTPDFQILYLPEDDEIQPANNPISNEFDQYQGYFQPYQL